MTTPRTDTPAIELKVSTWLNTEKPILLADLLDRVVLIHTFQMLCPGCLSHGIPQALRISKTFSKNDVVVLGLHTVFEHHAVMGPDALEVFLKEYRINYPVGIDQVAAGSNIPLTMQAYGLRGTPSIILIDREGDISLNHFGVMEDLLLGAHIGQLLSE